MSHIGEHPKHMSQWIVSLGISVLCCSVLFLVFSAYIKRLRDDSILTTVRVAALNEIQNQVVAETKYLNHTVTTTKKEITSLVQNGSEALSAAGADGKTLSSPQPAAGVPSQPAASVPSEPAVQAP
jgi:hypothetical protein